MGSFHLSILQYMNGRVHVSLFYVLLCNPGSHTPVLWILPLLSVFSHTFCSQIDCIDWTLWTLWNTYCLLYNCSHSYCIDGASCSNYCLLFHLLFHLLCHLLCHYSCFYCIDCSGWNNCCSLRNIILYLFLFFA